MGVGAPRVSNVGANAAFLVYALVWATFIFLVLRISSGTPLAQRFLISTAGVASLVALALSWLYVSHLLGPESVFMFRTKSGRSPS